MIPLRTRPRGLRFSLAELMGVVALSALVCLWPPLLFLVVPALAYHVARKLGATWGGQAWASFGLVLGAVYLPCIVGFFTDCSHCRGVWVRLFPIVPGIVPAFWMTAWFGFGRLPDQIEFGLAALVTWGIIGLLTITGRRGRGWLVAGLVIGCCYSGWTAMMVRAAVRS